MKQVIEIICIACVVFVSTIYFGLLFSLHFFWYPDWHLLNQENMTIGFIMPLTRALKFFTIAVPLMCLASVVLVATSWKTKFKWIANPMAIFVFLHTAISVYKLIPLNDKIVLMAKTKQNARDLLVEWMLVNDIRLVITAIVWSLSIFWIYLQVGKRP